MTVSEFQNLWKKCYKKILQGASELMEIHGEFFKELFDGQCHSWRSEAEFRNLENHSINYQFHIKLGDSCIRRNDMEYLIIFLT